MDKAFTILIVDDIVINRLMIKEHFSDTPYKMLEAENGREAINTLEAEDIDIIFMDIEMPVMHGIEAVKAIRKLDDPKKAKTIIIGLTAHDPGYFFEDYRNVSFDEILEKPYTADKINEVIEKYKK